MSSKDTEVLLCMRVVLVSCMSCLNVARKIHGAVKLHGREIGGYAI